MAMRQNYWNDLESAQVEMEKIFFQQLLIEHKIFEQATPEDARYFFFSLPSIIIMKGYALGFINEAVKQMLNLHIQQNRQSLSSRMELTIQYRIK